MLLSISSPEIKVELSTPTKAGVIIPSEDSMDEHERILMIVMPVMLNVEATV